MDLQQRTITERDGKWFRTILSIQKEIETDCNGDVWITVPSAILDTPLSNQQIELINQFYTISPLNNYRDVIHHSFITISNDIATFKTGIYSVIGDNFYRNGKTSDYEFEFYVPLLNFNNINYKTNGEL